MTDYTRDRRDSLVDLQSTLRRETVEYFPVHITRHLGHSDEALTRAEL